MWNNFIALVLVSGLLPFIPGTSEDTQKADLQHEIVVTATRVDTPTREIASSITVITGEDLMRSQKTTVIEALQEILGLSVLQTGPVGSSRSLPRGW